MENMLVSESKQNQQERKAKPQEEQPQTCPRCDSINTKFCYYNNYSLSQPRYFCKSCRRYWTKGGTLRNVPVGGGCRKTKRLSSSSLSNLKNAQSNPLLYDSSDLALAFSGLQKQPNGQLGFDNHEFSSVLGNPHFGNPKGNQPYMYLNGFYGNLGESETNFGDQMTTMKQEVCDFGFDDPSKVLFGFPWNGGIDEHESGREGSSWNHVIGINASSSSSSSSSSWHGVLNSVL